LRRFRRQLSWILRSEINSSV